jgi:hypothetical protein
MNEFDMYGGARWGYAFLKTDARISESDRMSILEQAVRAYLNEEDHRDIEGSGYEGRIHNSKQHKTLGAFTGCQFRAELDLDGHGK